MTTSDRKFSEHYPTTAAGRGDDSAGRRFPCPDGVRPHYREFETWLSQQTPESLQRKKIEADLPKLPAEATPEQIDRNQRMFEQRMREARKNAKQGEIFGAEAQPVIKRLLASVFAGPDGKELMARLKASGEEVKALLRTGTVPAGTDPTSAQAYANYIRRLQAGMSGFTCYASLQMPR